MKALFKPMLAVGLVLAAAGPLAVAPAAAQVVRGIGVIDLNAVINGSVALRTANEQRPTHYKDYYDAARQLSDQVDAQIQPMVAKLRADSQAPNPNEASLQQQQAAIRQISQQGQQEVSRILLPVVFSEEYVNEQIEGLLPQAIDNAAKAKNISLILNIDSGGIVYRDPAYNMNQEVIDALNTLLPVAQLVPPPNWLPRELREEAARRAAAQQAGGAAGAAAPATGEADTTPVVPPVVPPTVPAGPPVETR